MQQEKQDPKKTKKISASTSNSIVKIWNVTEFFFDS
jgi:hypothetical protein